MKIILLAIGKTDAGYFVEAINEYQKRLEHYIPFEIPVSYTHLTLPTKA